MHGHALARGTHPNALMAELYGKLEGCSYGYGGSMHLYDVERGNLGANAVVGGGLPAIVGAGLAFKLRGEQRVAVAFFGDGATNTGTFHESMNLAQLWQTNTLFVCENNAWAESTPGWQHSPVWNDMSKRAVAYGMPAVKIDGQNIEEVYEIAREALDRVRAGNGPVFLDVETFRMEGHYIGDAQVYRSKEDRAEAAAQDPIVRLRERLAVGVEQVAGEVLALGDDEREGRAADRQPHLLDHGDQPAPHDLEPDRVAAGDRARSLMHGIFVGEIQALEGAGRTCYDFDDAGNCRDGAGWFWRDKHRDNFAE